MSIAALSAFGGTFPAAAQPAAPPASADRRIQAGADARTGAADMAAGRMLDALSAWSSAARRFEAAGLRTEHLNALLNRAEILQQLGRHEAALADLDACRSLVGTVPEGQTRLAAVLGSQGRSHAALGRLDAAERLLQQSLIAAERQGDARLAGVAAIDLWKVRQQQDSGEAATALTTARDFARRSDDPVLRAGVALAEAKAALDNGRADAEQRLDAAQAAVEAVPEGFARNGARLGFATLALREGRAAGPGRLGTVYGMLQRVTADAAAAGDTRSTSLALGLAGELYEQAGRTQDALELTRRAIAAIRGEGEPALLYRWHWQAGRLLAGLGSRDEAIEAHQRALAYAEQLRPDLLLAAGGSGQRFREELGPVYLGAADLLLQRARSRGGAAAQEDLAGARQVIERMRSAELEDYYRDDCVAAVREKTVGIDRLSADTAALYPVLLPDRVEMIVATGDGLHSRIVTRTDGSTLPPAELVTDVRALRLGLERVAQTAYREPGRRLYDRLIRPLAAELDRAGVTTLVIVPDGPLRTIPFGALMDGNEFLAERFAVAVAPGLSLIDPRPLRRGRLRLLLAGLTVPSQGFAGLPHVVSEIRAIQALYGGDALLDADFRASEIARELRAEPYGVIHIASHGEFDRTPAGTFLLTYDGRLHLDGLRQLVRLSEFRDEPIELLTLSACRTAAGDDRAALGLAGVSLKAGARSALASLWYVDDEASAELTASFYRFLSDPALSRAQALQRAQVAMIRDPDGHLHRHPAFWAPFLLLGNWL